MSNPLSESGVLFSRSTVERFLRIDAHIETKEEACLHDLLLDGVKGQHGRHKLAVDSARTQMRAQDAVRTTARSESVCIRPLRLLPQAKPLAQHKS